MSRALVCESCGTTLPLPTTRERAEIWQLLSKTLNNKHYSMHLCGGCDDISARRQFEAIDGWSHK